MMMRLPNARREAFFSESSQEMEFTEALDQMLGELEGLLALLTPQMAETLHPVFSITLHRSRTRVPQLCIAA